MKTAHPKLDFPWRAGNEFRLLIDGAAIFPAMLEAIGQARRSVWLETYLMESGHTATAFITALRDAARRGVGVRVLLDDFGARGLHRDDRIALQTDGVRLHLYNPLNYGRLRRNLFRDHRKILVVDGELAFSGGWGITDGFSPDSPLPWRETGIQIQGPNAGDWARLFAANWGAGTGEALPSHKPPVAAGGQHGRVAIAMRRPYTEIKRHLLRRIRRCRHRLWLSTGYFVPSWKLRRALARAARRGRDVRLLLPGPLTDHPGVRFAGRRHYARLLRAGVRIFEYQPRILHQKVVLCDDWISIGSSNLDRWNFRWNLEANQEVEDAAFAAEAGAMLDTDLRHSEEIRLEDWLRRPRLERLREYVYGLIDQLSERVIRP